MKQSKSEWERQHAKQRALERYGIDFNKAKRNELISMIQAGKSFHTEKQSNKNTLHMLEFEGQTVKVVYDKIRKNIITFLPLENRNYVCPQGEMPGETRREFTSR